MNNRLIVLIKFNKTDRDNPMYNGMRFKKTLARAEWWESRLQILKEIVYPSLERQTFQDFDVVTPFSTDIDPKLASPMMDFLIEKGAYVSWDDRKLKDFVEPVPFFSDFYHDRVDNLIVVNHDSDDIYAPTAFEEIMSKPVVEGQTYIFRNGYVYDKETKRLAHYEGGGSPPPFYAMTFANRALKSQYEWDKYCREYGLKVEHPSLDKSKVKIDLSSGQFLYYFHEENVTSSWLNPHHLPKIKQLVTGDHKKQILELFGLSS